MSEATLEKAELLARLTKDLKSASELMSRREVRYLVDTYYQVQQFRITVDGQIRAAGDGEPSHLLQWISANMTTLENDIKKALGLFTMQYRVGRWLNSICGIGPVISSGLLAHLDVRGCQTVAPFSRFAGCDPTVKWLAKPKTSELLKELDAANKNSLDYASLSQAEGQERYAVLVAKTFGRRVEKIREIVSENKHDKLVTFLMKRPWNADLKVLLCFKAGESFVKVQSRDSDFYGKKFAEFKMALIEKNDAGGFKETAERVLAGKNFGKDTEAYAAYSTGILPKAHIHAMARRKTVKLFLSHLHHVMFEDYYEMPPSQPYAFVKLEGHRHYVAPPNWPMEGGKSLKSLLVTQPNATKSE